MTCDIRTKECQSNMRGHEKWKRKREARRKFEHEQVVNKSLKQDTSSPLRLLNSIDTGE